MYPFFTQSVFVQVTNKGGSTQDPPVTVQASVVSTLGSLEPERLTELAQEVKVSYSAKNLGLDNSMFGKVKEISLSSYLTHTLDAPTPSPAPSPAEMGPTISPSPDNGPLPPLSNSPSPSAVDPSCGGSNMSPVSDRSHHALPPRASTSSSLSPNISPLPAVSYESRPHQENGHQKGLAPSPDSVLPSSSSCKLSLFLSLKSKVTCCCRYPKRKMKISCSCIQHMLYIFFSRYTIE